MPKSERIGLECISLVSTGLANGLKLHSPPLSSTVILALRLTGSCETDPDS